MVRPCSIEQRQAFPRTPPTPTSGYIRVTVGEVLVVAVLLVLGLAYVLWTHLPFTRSPRDLKAVVAEWLTTSPEQLQCAAITVAAVNQGIVTLAGRITHEGQRQALYRGLKNLKGVTAVNDMFRIVPRPLCEVMDLLEPFKQVATEQGLRVQARLNKAEALPLYMRGENLVIEIKSFTDSPSYVYVDYYTADQAVSHLFPNQDEPHNVLEPHGTYTVGHVQGLRPWRIAPPFGLELVTVMTSKTPLLPASRFVLGEPVQAYVDLLRHAIRSVPPVDLAVTFHLITTRERL